MEKEEKFNQVYQKIINENEEEDMKKAIREAKKEKGQNIIVFIVIALIYIAINYKVYKLIDGISLELNGVLIIFLAFIYMFFIDRGGESKIAKNKKEFKRRIIETMIKSFEGQFEITTQYRIISRSI